MDKNKKAQMNYVNILIIAILVALLLIVFAGKLADFFSSSGKTGVCQASIYQSAITKQVTKSLATNLNCNGLPSLSISKGGVTSAGRISDGAVKKAIADKMIDCWNMIGKGVLDPYKVYEDNGKDVTYCLICSNLEFSSDFVQEAKDTNYNLSDFTYWLATNTVSDRKTSYFELLYGKTPTTDVINQIRSYQQNFDINDSYVIVWRLNSLKKSLWESGAKIIGATAGGAGAGAALGSIVPGIGTAAGAVTGGIIAVAGASYLVLVKDTGAILSSGLYFVPKTILGKNVVLNNGVDNETAPFCTQLVNY